MKIGLIARCEVARGIAIQSKNFYDHMPVDRVLLVRMPRPDCAEAPEWYSNRTEVAYDPRLHQLDEQAVRKWLEGLDVVFTVETPNDWRIPGWCREAGVKLVIQGNPEFVRHGRKGFEGMEHPDEWWWPTSWRTSHLPLGRLVPVPMPDVTPVRRVRNYTTLRLVHVVGKRAFGDRNGTDIVMKAMRFVQRRDCTLDVYGLDGSLGAVEPGTRAKVRLHHDGVPDRWSLYADQDVLVMPRRYGGLCLPALEAAACGLAVMMPDCSPNAELASILVAPRRTTPIDLACGRIDAVEVAPRDLAAAIDSLEPADEWPKLPLTWATGRVLYMAALEELVDQ